ncbi:TatD family hydrolase [Protaetiibacter mangrovi]|uniref:TatD family hydrolase n=1 Tax=Protaetiibacter mangrovi TaxID=2970926 RepID=A0ABT1ZHM3_9MICO|nr:TatD family hydrolase [Protaetiibacter mangrovi]MCS0500214.1 TatD family hydrolase [Protaetiibacter mangrovi]
MTDAFLRAREAPDGPPRDYPPLPEALVVPVYDNHTHLEIADSGEPLDYREHLDRASSVGVKGVVQVGTDLATSRWSAEVAAVEPRVLAAVALHPNDTPELLARGLLDQHLAGIDELATRPRVRAIGETGLDFFRTDESGRDAQFRSFEAHIDMAKRHGLALQIHDRDAHREVVETLDRLGAPERVVFHCFSGDAEFARLVAERGWYLSFAGTVTFKNAQNLRDALEVIPRSRILIETDAPYLTPTPFRGRPNAPYLIPHTLRAMAAHLGTDASMLAAQISSTTEEVYGHWDDEPVDAPRGPFDAQVVEERRAEHDASRDHT